MREECLICKGALEYLTTDIELECAICRKKERARARCVNGHYVCDECHTAGMDEMIALCLSERGRDPAAIVEKMMSMDCCHMHGPEHHFMVGAALLTAYRNAGGELDLPAALTEMYRRGKQVPGGACGFWGACGAGISAGMYVSIATGATPLAEEAWGLANRMTARALKAIGENGGPRCCKRDSYLALGEAAAFTAERLGVPMEMGEIRCTRSEQNDRCLGSGCPFYGKKEGGAI